MIDMSLAFRPRQVVAHSAAIVAAVAFQIGFCPAVRAADPVAHTDVRGSATILSPVSITMNHDLTLASVQLREARAFEIAIGPMIRVSTSSQSIGFLRQTPASFALQGQDRPSISWNVPSVIALRRIGGAEQLTVATWAEDVGNGPDNNTGGECCLSFFHVGGRIRVNPETVAGAYTGVLVATVQYN